MILFIDYSYHFDDIEMNGHGLGDGRNRMAPCSGSGYWRWYQASQWFYTHICNMISHEFQVNEYNSEHLNSFAPNPMLSVPSP